MSKIKKEEVRENHYVLLLAVGFLLLWNWYVAELDWAAKDVLLPCNMCSVTSLFVTEIGLIVQLGLGPKSLGLGRPGCPRVGDAIICPLSGVTL